MINGIMTINNNIAHTKLLLDLLLGYVIVSDDCSESGSSLPISSGGGAFCSDNCGWDLAAFDKSPGTSSTE